MGGPPALNYHVLPVQGEEGNLGRTNHADTVGSNIGSFGEEWRAERKSI
jgi:hypothetical protein